MNFSYQTIANPVEEISFKEKGSKFIGYAFPVLDEDEIKENLIQLWQKYPDATHICYAFRLDRKSTRLNSSHVKISYAVFCLKKKKKNNKTNRILNKYTNIFI